jgi:quercetin dioxygenase-like cupin family protein
MPKNKLQFSFGKEVPMKRNAVMITLVLAIGIGIGMIGSQFINAQQAPVTRTILQQKDLEGSAGREVIMFRAEMVPGGVAGRHYHPGPELFYVLEGALTLELDGQPPVTLKAGESAYSPAKHIHNAKNASTTQPWKVIGFLVGEKGQPLATPVQ